MNNKSLIIVVTYNSQEFIESCLCSIINQNYKDWFLLVIDNASSDNTVARIREFRNMYPEINASNFKLIVLKRNIGFAAAVNYAVFNFIVGKKRDIEKHLEFLILLNPDVYLNCDAFKKIISSFKITNRKNEKNKKGLLPGKIGAAGGLILNYKGNLIQHLGGKINDNFITSHLNFGKDYSELKREMKLKKAKGDNLNPASKIIDVDYITGAFFATEFKLFKSIGGFDTGYCPVYFEELDYCLKVRRIKKRVVVNYDSVARHFEGASVIKFSRNFYKFYHKNRIRCAVINLGFLDFFKKFFKAELYWIKNKATGDQVFPLFYAYFKNFLFLPYNLIIKLKNHLILSKLELK